MKFLLNNINLSKTRFPTNGIRYLLLYSLWSIKVVAHLVKACTNLVQNERHFLWIGGNTILPYLHWWFNRRGVWNPLVYPHRNRLAIFYVGWDPSEVRASRQATVAPHVAKAWCGTVAFRKFDGQGKYLHFNTWAHEEFGSVMSATTISRSLRVVIPPRPHRRTRWAGPFWLFFI